VPLGPFQAKAFATSISPWIVTREALEPFRVHGPAQDPMPLPYLQQAQPNNYDLQLDVGLRAAQVNEAATICRTNFKYMYWSSVQQLVHHASSGCAMNVGDLLGSGTISGPEKHGFMRLPSRRRADRSGGCAAFPATWPNRPTAREPERPVEKCNRPARTSHRVDHGMSKKRLVEPGQHPSDIMWRKYPVQFREVNRTSHKYIGMRHQPFVVDGRSCDQNVDVRCARLQSSRESRMVWNSFAEQQTGTIARHEPGVCCGNDKGEIGSSRSSILLPRNCSEAKHCAIAQGASIFLAAEMMAPSSSL
jgi:hypothetical protein